MSRLGSAISVRHCGECTKYRISAMTGNYSTARTGSRLEGNREWIMGGGGHLKLSGPEVSSGRSRLISSKPFMNSRGSVFSERVKEIKLINFGLEMS